MKNAQFARETLTESDVHHNIPLSLFIANLRRRERRYDRRSQVGCTPVRSGGETGGFDLLGTFRTWYLSAQNGRGQGFRIPNIDYRLNFCLMPIGSLLASF